MGSEQLREEDFGEERLAELRSQVAALMEAEQVSAASVAREAEVGNSTLSAWLRNSYNGNNAAVGVQMHRWLASRKARTRTRTTLRRAPAFVWTAASRAFVNVMEHAQFAPDLSVIVGAPGVGKTMTAHRYISAHPNVWMLTAEPCSGNPRAMLEDMAEAVGVPALGNSGQRVSKAIVRRIAKSGGLILVDEAQNLSSQSLDQLRTIHDMSEIGVVLMGNPEIFGRLEGGAHRKHFAQLYSRVGMRVTRPQAARGDVDALLDAWEIADKGVRGLCHAVARGGGALRTMTKVLQQAHQRAEGGALSETHVLEAAQQLGAGPQSERGA